MYNYQYKVLDKLSSKSGLVLNKYIFSKYIQADKIYIIFTAGQRQITLNQTAIYYL